MSASASRSRAGNTAGAASGARRLGRGSGTGSTEARRSSVGPVSISTLYRGRVRLGLIRDLAMGEWTHGEIAKSIGCRVADVAAFADEHVTEIEEVRAALAANLALETAGLWITKKSNRLAEYQADVDDINAIIAIMRRPGQPPGQDLGSKRHVALARLKLANMKAVAEELDPPRRGAIRPGSGDDEDRNVVHYVIEAADDITPELT